MTRLSRRQLVKLGSTTVAGAALFGSSCAQEAEEWSLPRATILT